MMTTTECNCWNCTENCGGCRQITKNFYGLFNLMKIGMRGRIWSGFQCIWLQLLCSHVTISKNMAVSSMYMFLSNIDDWMWWQLLVPCCGKIMCWMMVWLYTANGFLCILIVMQVIVTLLAMAGTVFQHTSIVQNFHAQLCDLGRTPQRSSHCGRKKRVTGTN